MFLSGQSKISRTCSQISCISFWLYHRLVRTDYSRFFEIYFQSFRFYRWPLDALVAVSDVYLNRFEILVKSNTIKKNVIELMADIHDDVSRICENYYDKFRRRTYTTPKSFLS